MLNYFEMNEDFIIVISCRFYCMLIIFIVYNIPHLTNLLLFADYYSVVRHEYKNDYMCLNRLFEK